MDLTKVSPETLNQVLEHYKLLEKQFLDLTVTVKSIYVILFIMLVLVFVFFSCLIFYKILRPFF